MESARVRQPGAGSAAARAGRTGRLAFGLTGALLAGELAYLQPLGAIHLFPTRPLAPPAAAARAAPPAPPVPLGHIASDLAAPPVAAAPTQRPAATSRAAAPAAPAAAATMPKPRPPLPLQTDLIDDRPVPRHSAPPADGRHG